jgi:hypothetical protein
MALDKETSMKAIYRVALSVVFAGCSHSRAVMPALVGPPPEPALTLVWVGRGETERLENGTWKRAPEFDYEFSVEQRRYENHWESVKSLRRRNPAYDGSAGPWEQLYFFKVDYSPAAPDGAVTSTIASTLGAGKGKTDREFREAAIELSPDISSFAPFNTYRITQHYRYEQGELEEMVELIKRENGKDNLWVRNHEKAKLFAAHSYSAPPTVRPPAP